MLAPVRLARFVKREGERAEAVHCGWRPALAGIEDAPRPDGPDAGRDDA